jgi:hypothetical protein
MPADQHVNPAEEPSPGVVRRIGRRPDNHIVVSDLGVSKQHAELRRTPAGRYTIVDLGSHGGTYVNGTRVSQQELNEGDIIAIGRATFFRLAGSELIECAGEVDEETALLRARDLAAELRRELDAREQRIDSLRAELRALAARNPAVLPVLDELGISPEPEA